MRMRVLSWLPRGSALLFMLCSISSLALAGSQPHYLITNDDAAFGSNLTFYTVSANGSLKLAHQVSTGGFGIGGGYFGANRIVLLNSASQQCVYASDAGSNDIVGVDLNSLLASGTVTGSSTDSGNANGIGLALNSQYLYASFTTSNTIGTFQIQSGCSLTFVNDTPVVGLQGGFADGMALHGNLLVVTYGDGSIESFDISSGVPVSKGDKRNSTGYVKSQGSSYPTSVLITQDGHFALFGDTSTSSMVEVSDISSGTLTRTTTFFLGKGLNSSNLMLSPDETLLYVANTQGGGITAATFDKSTGKLAYGCTSGGLKGYGTAWSYLAGLVLATNSGSGGTIYVAEYSGASSIGMVEASSSGGTCTLKEISGSPVSDPNSAGLLSIGVFPPASF